MRTLHQQPQTLQGQPSAAPLRLPNGAVLVQTLNGGLFAVSL